MDCRGGLTLRLNLALWLHIDRPQASPWVKASTWSCPGKARSSAVKSSSHGALWEAAPNHPRTDRIGQSGAAAHFSGVLGHVDRTLLEALDLLMGDFSIRSVASQ